MAKSLVIYGPGSPPPVDPVNPVIPSVTLTGTLLTTAGQPVNGAAVTITLNNGTVISLTTNGSGVFTTTGNYPNGQTTVSVVSPAASYTQTPAIGAVTVNGGGTYTFLMGPTPSPLWGNLPDGTRDKFKIGYASTSHWLTSLGASATLTGAGLVTESFDGYNTFLYVDEDIVVLDPTAPSLNVEYNGVGWDVGDRCLDQGSTIQTVRCPSGFVVPDSGENNSAIFLDADGVTLKSNQPFTRCVASGHATSLVTFSDKVITGDGLHGSHGGGDFDAYGGTIMPGEWSAGYIRHALKILVRASKYLYRDTVTPSNSYRWPAFTKDGYSTNDPVTGYILGTAPAEYGGRGYGGTNNQFKMGSLLCLSPSYNINALSTVPAKIIAKALQDYGAYVCDDAYANGIGFVLGRTKDGTAASEFYSLWGYSFRREPLSDGHPFSTDMVSIITNLQIVTNNSAVNIGGGGTRRAPTHAAIGN